MRKRIVAYLLVLAFVLSNLPVGIVAQEVSTIWREVVSTDEGNQGVEIPEGTEGNEGEEAPEGTEGTEGEEIPEGTEGTEGEETPEGTEGTEGEETPEGTEGTEGEETPEGTEGTEGEETPEGTEGTEGVETPEGTEGTGGVETPDGTEGTEGEEIPEGMEGTEGEETPDEEGEKEEVLEGLGDVLPSVTIETNDSSLGAGDSYLAGIRVEGVEIVDYLVTNSGDLSHQIEVQLSKEVASNTVFKMELLKGGEQSQYYPLICDMRDQHIWDSVWDVTLTEGNAVVAFYFMPSEDYKTIRTYTIVFTHDNLDKSPTYDKNDKNVILTQDRKIYEEDCYMERVVVEDAVVAEAIAQITGKKEHQIDIVLAEDTPADAIIKLKLAMAGDRGNKVSEGEWEWPQISGAVSQEDTITVQLVGGEAALSLTIGYKSGWAQDRAYTIHITTAREVDIVPPTPSEFNEPIGYPVYPNTVPDDWENDLWLQFEHKDLVLTDKPVRIFPRRVPQIIDNWATNTVTRPNFTYYVAEGDSISLSSNNGDDVYVTPIQPGTTVVRVAYDEVAEDGASSVVNTAYAIFTVGEEGAIYPEVGSTLDGLTSYDTLYYTGDRYALSFTATATDVAASGKTLKSLEVTLNGEVLTEANGRYTAYLDNRSNIIGVVATDSDDQIRSYYKVVDARKVEVVIENKTAPGLAPAVGNTVSVGLRGITMPVYKLATIYNPCYNSERDNTTAAYISYHNNKLGELKGICGQWDLATKNSFELTFTEAGTYQFEGNGIHGQAWAKPIGTDKIDDTIGGTNTGSMYPVINYKYSVLPDFSIEVVVDNGMIPVTDIAFGKTKLTLKKGQRLTEEQMLAVLGGVTISPQNATNKQYNWTTSDPFTLNLYNGFYAQQIGEATLYATTVDGKKVASCVVEVVADVAPPIGPEVPDVTGETVTFSVDKLTIGKGYVVSPKAVAMQDGESIWEVTKRLLDQEGIPYEYTFNSNYNSVYISAIDGDGEFDHGAGSGWMYSVNGTYPEVGASSTYLRAGDEVKWRYTTNYGADVGRDTSKDQATGDGAGQEQQPVPVKPTITVTETGIVATVNSSMLQEAVALAKANDTAWINIAVEVTEAADQMAVKLEKNGLKAIGEQSTLGVAITTPLGEMQLPAEVVSHIVRTGVGEDVTVLFQAGKSSSPMAAALTSENAIVVEVTITAGTKQITTFDGKEIQVTVPVTDDFVVGEHYQVYILSADGSVDEKIGEVVEREGKRVITVATTHLSTFIIQPTKLEAQALPFEDVIDHWAMEAIAYVYERGVMNGVGDRQFAPEQGVTRAMLAAVLHRIEAQPQATTTGEFVNVADGKWYSEAINWVKETGLMVGVTTDQFAPNSVLTGAQLAAVLQRYVAYRDDAIDAVWEHTYFATSTQVTRAALATALMHLGY